MTEQLGAEIERLETRIEKLARTMDSCRKFILAAKIAIAVGAIWFVLAPFAIVRFDVTAMLCALAAVIGGIVVLGSNTSTLRQASDDARAAENLRNELIGREELKIVSEDVAENSIVPWPSRTLH